VLIGAAIDHQQAILVSARRNAIAMANAYLQNGANMGNFPRLFVLFAFAFVDKIANCCQSFSHVRDDSISSGLLKSQRADGAIAKQAVDLMVGEAGNLWCC